MNESLIYNKQYHMYLIVQDFVFGWFQLNHINIVNGPISYSCYIWIILKRRSYTHQWDAQDVRLVRHLHGLGVAYFIGYRLLSLSACQHACDAHLRHVISWVHLFRKTLGQDTLLSRNVCKRNHSEPNPIGNE